jgi:hypothetical protein
MENYTSLITSHSTFMVFNNIMISQNLTIVVKLRDLKLWLKTLFSSEYTRTWPGILATATPVNIAELLNNIKLGS